MMCFIKTTEGSHPIRMYPSQTEGTGSEFHSRYLMSYSMLVTNLNAAQILLRPKWPQLLVTASSSCCESEPNSCMPPVNRETLQCKYPKLISILIKETFLLTQSIFSNCYFQKLGPFYDKEPFYRKVTDPTPRADRNRPLETWILRKPGSNYPCSIQSITSPTELAISSTAPRLSTTRYLCIILDSKGL